METPVRESVLPARAEGNHILKCLCARFAKPSGAWRGSDSKRGDKIKKALLQQCFFDFGDPYGNRTHVSSVRG